MAILLVLIDFVRIKGFVVVDIVHHQEKDDSIEIYFAVTDSGIGIPSDKRDIILNGFDQVEDSTIREGAGLGLSISNQLIRLHKSKLQIESEVGVGSKFYFTISFEKLPGSSGNSIKGSAQNISLKATQKKHPLAGRKILLVEDNLINQKITKKMLEKWKMEVSVAENGKIAVEKVTEESFDLVLMDLQMPVMNGIDATRRIREMGGEFKQLPIIALTASAVLKIKEEALGAGLNYFITKPFRPDYLFEKLNEYLPLQQFED